MVSKKLILSGRQQVSGPNVPGMTQQQPMGQSSQPSFPGDVQQQQQPLMMPSQQGQMNMMSQPNQGNFGGMTQYGQQQQQSQPMQQQQPMPGQMGQFSGQPHMQGAMRGGMQQQRPQQGMMGMQGIRPDEGMNIPQGMQGPGGGVPNPQSMGMNAQRPPVQCKCGLLIGEL